MLSGNSGAGFYSLIIPQVARIKVAKLILSGRVWRFSDAVYGAQRHYDGCN